MRHKGSRQLHSDVAMDLGWSETPKRPAAQGGFGRGYNIGSLTFFTLFIASFINLYFALGHEVSVWRAIGYILIITGVGFTWLIGYTVITRKGIPWGTNFFGRTRVGVHYRENTPIAYWIAIAIALLIFTALIVGGVYVWANAPSIVAKLGRA